MGLNLCGIMETYLIYNPRVVSNALLRFKRKTPKMGGRRFVIVLRVTIKLQKREQEKRKPLDKLMLAKTI